MGNCASKAVKDDKGNSLKQSVCKVFRRLTGRKQVDKLVQLLVDEEQANKGTCKVRLTKSQLANYYERRDKLVGEYADDVLEAELLTLGRVSTPDLTSDQIKLPRVRKKPKYKVSPLPTDARDNVRKDNNTVPQQDQIGKIEHITSPKSDLILEDIEDLESEVSEEDEVVKKTDHLMCGTIDVVENCHIPPVVVHVKPVVDTVDYVSYNRAATVVLQAHVDDVEPMSGSSDTRTPVVGGEQDTYAAIIDWVNAIPCDDDIDRVDMMYEEEEMYLTDEALSHDTEHISISQVHLLDAKTKAKARLVCVKQCYEPDTTCLEKAPKVVDVMDKDIAGQGGSAQPKTRRSIRFNATQPVHAPYAPIQAQIPRPLSHRSIESPVISYLKQPVPGYKSPTMVRIQPGCRTKETGRHVPTASKLPVLHQYKTEHVQNKADGVTCVMHSGVARGIAFKPAGNIVKHMKNTCTGENDSGDAEISLKLQTKAKAMGGPVKGIVWPRTMEELSRPDRVYYTEQFLNSIIFKQRIQKKKKGISSWINGLTPFQEWVIRHDGTRELEDALRPVRRLKNNAKAKIACWRDPATLLTQRSENTKPD